MYSTDDYICFSMPELFGECSEAEINDKISSFKCKKSDEVQNFLINDSIEFTKKHQAITYLIFDNGNNLVAYFSLSIKPITIKTEKLSNTSIKKLTRISDIVIDDNDEEIINPAAYLIAQLGKNENAKININEIFQIINYYIDGFQNGCGGVVEFLEAENSEKLLEMYKDIGFKIFNIRNSNRCKDNKLIQMYRLI